MKIQGWFVAGVLLAASVSAMAAPQSGCVRLADENGAFAVCAPAGWVVDTAVMGKSGVDAAFYPASLTFEKAKKSGAIMYISMVRKKVGGPLLSEFIQSDGELLKQKLPKAQIVAIQPIAMGENSASVREYKPGEFNRYEAVAYMETPGMVGMCVISAIGPQELKANYPAFVKMVQSFEMSDVQRAAVQGVPVAAGGGN
jgi:hypothetical protein